MRKVILTIFVGILLCEQISAQSKTDYSKALNYIVDDNRGKSMVVSDSTVNIGFSGFWEKIDSLYGEKREELLNRLDSLDGEKGKSQSIFGHTQDLKFKGKGAVFVIFFSGFYKNMLIGEIIFQRNKKHPFVYSQQTSQNESKQYLFVFDKNHKITNVFKSQVFYE